MSSKSKQVVKMPGDSPCHTFHTTPKQQFKISIEHHPRSLRWRGGMMIAETFRERLERLDPGFGAKKTLRSFELQTSAERMSAKFSGWIARVPGPGPILVLRMRRGCGPAKSWRLQNVPRRLVAYRWYRTVTSKLRTSRWSISSKRQ